MYSIKNDSCRVSETTFLRISNFQEQKVAGDKMAYNRALGVVL